MVAEIIAGITLCNSAYKAIKESINNCKEVSQIAGHIDNLIDGKSEIDEGLDSVPTSAVGQKWQSFLGKKIGNANPLSVGAIAQEKINQKLAAEELEQVRKMVNKRFGYGTWEEILMERDHRVEKAKTAAQKERNRKQKAWDKAYNIMMQIFWVALAVGGLAAFFWFWVGDKISGR